MRLRMGPLALYFKAAFDIVDNTVALPYIYFIIHEQPFTYTRVLLVLVYIIIKYEASYIMMSWCATEAMFCYCCCCCISICEFKWYNTHSKIHNNMQYDYGKIPDRVEKTRFSPQICED